MRKPQIQPALASLSETDREQLADWLRHGDYDDVLARVNQPRPEGLGLHISKKPLQTFCANPPTPANESNFPNRADIKWDQRLADRASLSEIYPITLGHNIRKDARLIELR